MSAVFVGAAIASQAATMGKGSKQLVPYLPHFQWNPKDARFFDAPAGFIVFDSCLS